LPLARFVLLFLCIVAVNCFDGNKKNKKMVKATPQGIAFMASERHIVSGPF
jgi:hypothetical protein